MLGKALAGGIPRRTALKILAGAALSSVFGITAGCNSPTKTTNPSSTNTPISRSGSVCPPLEQSLCCTSAQFQVCEKDGSTAFAQSIEACVGECSGSQSSSAACQVCTSAAIDHSLSVYTTCITTTCLALSSSPPPLPTPDTSSSLWLQVGRTPRQVAGENLSAQSSTPALLRADPQSCDYGKIYGCFKAKQQEAIMCMTRCAIKVYTGRNPVNCPSYCYAKQSYDIYHCAKDNDPCVRPTFCTSQGICCLVEDTCCPSVRITCGSTCCDPMWCEDCVNGSCRSTCGSCQVCDNGSCLPMCGDCEKCENDVCVSTCNDCCVHVPNESGGYGNVCMSCMAGFVCCNNACVPDCSGSHKILNPQTCQCECPKTPDGWQMTDCNGTCIDTRNNLTHCGSCDNDCRAVCNCWVEGCTTTCCNGVCKNTASGCAYEHTGDCSPCKNC
jgi:hypothetical protein